MGLMDILQQYMNAPAVPPQQAEAHFDQVASAAPSDLLGRGIAAALGSDRTPPVKDLVTQLFANSNPQQRAGLLNELLRTLGPSALSGIAGSVLGQVLGRVPSAQGGALPQVTPAQASQITPQQAGELAAHAEATNPSVVDHIGNFYAQHPQVVKALGGIVLAIALGRMADHRR